MATLHVAPADAARGATAHAAAARRLAHVASHLTAASASAAAATTTGLRYTVDGCSVLTPAQRRFYEQNGYFVVPRLVTPERLERFNKRFLEFAEGRAEKPPTMTVMRDVVLAKSGAGKALGEKIITKIQDFQDDPEMFDACLDPKILHYVEAFCGPNIKTVHTMCINKPPDLGVGSSRHPLHQDLHYFPFRPADRIVAVWTAMQHIDMQNGCLVVVPGSHKGELLEHGYPPLADGVVNKMYHGIMTPGAGLGGVPLIMEPGDTVFFHPLLHHGSGPNLTDRFRRSLCCHYASTQCDYIDIKGTSQEAIGREVEEIARRRAGGMEVAFADVWRFKSRLVRGKDGTL